MRREVTMSLAIVAAFMMGNAAAAPMTGRSEGVTGHVPLNQPNLTGTGATVPLHGVSKGDGVTPFDRIIEQKDDELTRGICANCW